MLGVGPVGNVVRVGDLGDNPLHWEGVGRIPPQGGPQADRVETLAKEVSRMGIPPSEGCDGGGGTAEGGDLRIPLL